MAGHSKWANIKHRKAAKDAKKGVAYAKCSRELMMAAKIGGDDPAGNFRLRTAIDRAKSAGLPNDTIQRAIDKGAGKLESEQMETVIYEGYGPGGVAVFIETMTDNRNRTAGDIRSYFNKYDGNLGSDGCVAWMFEEQGAVDVTPPDAICHAELFDDALLDAVANAGGQDVVALDDDSDIHHPKARRVVTAPSELNAVAEALNQAGFTVHSAELIRVTDNEAPLTDAGQVKQFLKLFDAIDGHDDVQSVVTNAAVDESILAELEG